MALHAPRSEPITERLPTGGEVIPDGSVIIRYAETDDDVIAMHRFLLIVAQPAMQCPVDGQDSLMEIIRVTKHEVALMAIQDGKLVGTMGIISPTWWYNTKARFLTDRWHFVLPQLWHSDVNKALMGEALKIAADAGLKFFHQGKVREKGGVNLFMPRSYAPPSPQIT